MPKERKTVVLTKLTGTKVCKVVHIPADVHTDAKAYCVRKGLKMKDWVSGLVHEKIQEEEG